MARDLRLVKPAVVRIESHAKATISVATIGFDQAALEAFARRHVADLLAAGQRYSSVAVAEQALTSDLEHEFVANPAPYLELGERATDPYDTARVGSGWVADGGGTVVTAADVLLDEGAVTAAATEEERQAITADLNDLTPADLGLTVPLSDPQKTNIVNAALARAVPSIQVSGISAQTTVQFGSAVPGQQTGTDVRLDVHIEVIHRDPDGLGLAVLRVQGGPLASIPVAFGSALGSGSPVVVAGYPAAEATSGGAPDTGPVAPEAVEGTVGDAVPGGGALTSAGYTAGVIGGPVVDADGKAVGVAVKHDGASAVVPIADVARVLDEAHARSRTNSVTRDYRAAAADMSRHWYKKALPVLQSLRQRSPDLPWVSEQTQEAAQEIALGHDESPTSRPFLPVALAAVLFAVDAVAVTTVLRRRAIQAVTPPESSGRPAVRAGPWRRRGRGRGLG